MNPNITPAETRCIDGIWWAVLNHPVIGYVDARGTTENLSLANLAVELRKAREAHFRQCAAVMIAEKAARNEIAEQILKRDRARELTV